MPLNDAQWEMHAGLNGKTTVNFGAFTNNRRLDGFCVVNFRRNAVKAEE
jgi:hypothetical protein